MPKTNYVLIDFENVQQINIDLIYDEYFKILIFAGSNQHKVPIELSKKTQKFGTRLEWITTEGSGPNALDFHIAFYLGDLSSKFPDSFFHIISKDKGFDPLIKTLKQKKIFCLREESIEAIPLIKSKLDPKPVDKMAILIEKLSSGPKPKTKARLTNAIKTLFHQAITDSEVEDMISEMIKVKNIEIIDNKITYFNAV